MGARHSWVGTAAESLLQGPRHRSLKDEVKTAIWGWSLQTGTALSQTLFSAGLGDPGSLGTIVGSMSLFGAAPLGAAVGFCKWAGASVLGAIKSSLPAAIAFEVVAAKTLDYQLSTRLRAEGSVAEPFFISMSRAGLEAGWAGRGDGLPWWYAPLSYGATGGMDFFLGQIIGAQLRQSFDGVTTPHLVPGSEEHEALAKLFRASMLQVLAEALTPDEDVRLQSPLARHLLGALRSEHDPKVVAAVHRRLVVANPGHPVAGTLVGHGAAGASIGLCTGDPLLGLTVGLLDAAGDAVLTQAALAGRIQTLSKVKAQLLYEGWQPPSEGLRTNLADYYAQIGVEFRDLGRDLRKLAHVGQERMIGLAQHARAIEDWLGRELEIPPPRGLLTWILGEQLASWSEHWLVQAEAALEEHAEVPWSDALKQDFPMLARGLTAALQQLRAAVLAASLTVNDDASQSPPPPTAGARRSQRLAGRRTVTRGVNRQPESKGASATRLKPSRGQKERRPTTAVRPTGTSADDR